MGGTRGRQAQARPEDLLAERAEAWNQLRPTRLKIDRQLVMPITSSPGQRRLVGSIIEIGASLGIEAIAEGVESFEHAKILADMGCSALQGYAIARPMDGNAVTQFVASQSWRNAS